MPHMAAVQDGPRSTFVPIYSTDEIDAKGGPGGIGGPTETAFISLRQPVPEYDFDIWSSFPIGGPSFPPYMGSFQGATWERYWLELNDVNRNWPYPTLGAASIAVDQSGRTWAPGYADLSGGGFFTAARVLWMVDADPGSTTPCFSTFPPPPSLAPFGLWRDVAIGPTGIVYIAEDSSGGPAQGGIVTYDPSTATWGRIATPNSAALGIAVDKSGNLVVVEGVVGDYSSTAIYVISPAGVLLGSSAPLVGSYSKVVVDSSNNIWAWGLNTTLVARCANLPGMAVTTYDVGRRCSVPGGTDPWPGDRPGVWPACPFFMGSIAVDASDNVWVTANDGDPNSQLRGFIIRVSPLGVVTLFDVWTLFGWTPGTLEYAPTPFAVAAAPDGTIYATLEQFTGPPDTNYRPGKRGDIMVLRPGFGPGGEDVVEAYQSNVGPGPAGFTINHASFRNVGKILFHGGRVLGIGHSTGENPPGPIQGTLMWFNRVDVSQWRAVLTPPPGRALAVTGINIVAKGVGTFGTTPTLFLRFQRSGKWVASYSNNNSMPQYYVPGSELNVQGAVDEPLEVRGPANAGGRGFWDPNTGSVSEWSFGRLIYSLAVSYRIV